MATKNGSDRLAVMIDADNAQAALVQELLAEISRYGTATVKRAYGDWTQPNLRPWRDVLHAHAVQPMQQFRYTTGKNATDSALIIDAMDVLHSGNVDGFCLVSSDSDFTRLATRIREAGLVVYGFGERHTPTPFQAACNKFVYTEILRDKPEEPVKENKAERGGDAEKPPAVPELPKLRPLVLKALEVRARDDGWSTLSALGSQLTRNHPSFDSRNYGESKLGDLIRKQAYLETKEVPVGDAGTHINLYVRRKSVPASKAG